MDILKSSGIGKDIGTEEDAKQRWVNFLGQFGYTPDQSFPDNMTKGTTRVSGDVALGKKTTTLNHLFNPNWQTYTYYDTETNIPLYTKTRGTVPSNSSLIVWGGFQGMREIIGNRVPTDNPKKTKIRRETKEGYSSVAEIIRAIDILDRDKTGYQGQLPLAGWTKDKSTEEQQEFLEQQHPEYLEYLIRNLHQPIEAEGVLEELTVSKDKAEAVKLVENLTRTKHQGLSDKIYNEHVQMDNDKWILVVFVNSRLKPKAEALGFINLEKGNNAYMKVLLSQLDSKVPAYIKEALKQLQTSAELLPSKTSEYFIRAPNGERIGLDEKKAWISNLKREGKDTMFDTIRKKASKSWFGIIKAPEYEEDEKDNPPLKDKDETANIRERRQRKDFKEDVSYDPFTARRKAGTELAEERGTVQTDSHCCRKFKILLKDFLKFKYARDLNMMKDEHGYSMLQKNNLDKWMDNNLSCRDIEEAFSYVVSETQHHDGTDVYMENELVLELGYAGGPEQIIIDLNRMGIADRYAGKGMFIPKEDWEMPDPNANPNAWFMDAGPKKRGLSFKMWWDECIKGHVEHTLSEPVNPEADVFYEDAGVKNEDFREMRQKILDMFVLRGGKMKNTHQPDEQQMEEEMPDLFQQWARLGQISDTGEDGKITPAEMNENTKSREKIMDYLDEMNAMRKKPKKKIDRKKTREHHLDDYTLSNKKGKKDE